MWKLLVGALATMLIAIGAAAQMGTVHVPKIGGHEVAAAKHVSSTHAPARPAPGRSMGRLVESPPQPTAPPTPSPPPSDDGD